MKRQNGAALIVVLSLLTVSLMVGLSSMQSSQIDERLAGNYKAKSEAQMAAEEAVAVAIKADPALGSFSSTKVSSLQNISFGDFDNDDLFYSDNASDGACSGNVSCTYRYVKKGIDFYIISFGYIEGEGGKISTLSEPVVVEINVAGGFGVPSATVFPGGIAHDADIQWPTSNNSRMAGGNVEVNGEDEDVYAVSLYEYKDVAGVGQDGVTAQDILDDVNKGNNKTGLNGGTLSGDNYPYYGLVRIIRDIYNDYMAEGDNASSEYPGVYFYEDGMSVTGNDSMSGLHVVLNGEVQIGGNASLSGALVVLNVDAENGDWTLKPASKAKFNGGGNKGTVWFDEDSLSDAIEPFGYDVLDYLGFSAISGGSDFSITNISSWK